jgi:hypothetical protein
MASADLNVASKVELETLAIVRPGDTLVVAYPRQLSVEQADTIKARIKDRLPGVEVVIIHANQLAVYRPDGA